MKATLAAMANFNEDEKMIFVRHVTSSVCYQKECTTADDSIPPKSILMFFTL